MHNRLSGWWRSSSRRQEKSNITQNGILREVRFDQVTRSKKTGYLIQLPHPLLLLALRFIALIVSDPLINLPPAPPHHSTPQHRRTRHRAHRHHRHKHQRFPHISLRIPALIVLLQRITHHDEDSPQQLPSRPAERGTPFGPGRIRDLNRPLQRDGHEAEARGAEDGGDEVGRDDGAGAGGPDEGEVGEGDDGDEGADEEEVALGAVDDGGGDCGGDKADEDEQRAGDAGFGFREGVRGENLREEGGDGVEEADVDGEGGEEEEVVRVVGEEAEGLFQG